MPGHVTEKTLQAKVIKWCREQGYLTFKFASPANAGVPDLIIIGNGKVIFYELKHPNGSGRVTELQAITHERMREHGAEVYVGYNFIEITDVIRHRLG